VPWHLSTREFVQQIRRVLTPNGVYVLNVIDNPPLEFLAAELRTVAAVFDHVAVAANPAALRGSDGGNYVLIASAQPLPEAALREQLAARSQPLKLATESIGLRELMDDAPILTDDYAPVDQLLTTS
jgi:spermidine synthase